MTDPADPSPATDSIARSRPFWLILALAAILRAAWAVVVPIVPISDCNAYDICAKNLAAFNTFGYDPHQPWAFWPVGTSFAYSLVYCIFDPAQYGYGPIAALNVILGILLVALTMLAAQRWCGRRPALAAGLLMALWPTQIEFSTIMASETLFTVLCLAGAISWPEKLNIGRLLLCGLVFAAASYVRSTALLIPIVLAGAEWLRAPRLKAMPTSAAAVALTFLVMAIAIAPWEIRNHRLFGRTVLIATNGGSNLWMGNNPQTTGGYQPPPERPDLNEAERDAECGRIAREYILSHPIAFVKRTIYKAVRLHATETIGVGWNIEGLKRIAPTRIPDEKALPILALKGTSTAYWLAVLALSIPGLIILARRTSLWQAITNPATVLWAYFTAVHAIVVIQDRYHLPATPMIAALAGVALAAWLPKLRPASIP